MTREEAIKILEHYAEYWKKVSDEEAFPIDDDIEALQMAVEALQQKTGKCIPSKAVKIFTEAYRKTQTRLYVKKPMSYAFYEVWKYYDRHEKPRW